MKKLFTLLFCMMGALVTMSAQGKLTPNEQQARRLFDEAYNMVYGPKGSQLTYSVNIIGIYKTKGTIWTMGKMSKFADEKYIAWNDNVTYYRFERKKNTVTIYDAHDDERDKYATKFKFFILCCKVLTSQVIILRQKSIRQQTKEPITSKYHLFFFLIDRQCILIIIPVESTLINGNPLTFHLRIEIVKQHFCPNL